MHVRSAIQDRAGKWHRHIQLPDGVRFFPEILRQAGYYCSNSFKEDCQVPTPEYAWDESGPAAHWRNWPDSTQPFFHVVYFITTHESQVQRVTPEDERGPADLSSRRMAAFGEQMKAHGYSVFNHAQLPAERRVDPDRVLLPPYFPDTSKRRNDPILLVQSTRLVQEQRIRGGEAQAHRPAAYRYGRLRLVRQLLG